MRKKKTTNRKTTTKTTTTKMGTMATRSELLLVAACNENAMPGKEPLKTQ